MSAAMSDSSPSQLPSIQAPASNGMPVHAWDYVISCRATQITANDRRPPHLQTLGWLRISLLAVS